MVRNFILLFLSLRAADLLNLVGGLWLVPTYVAPEDLGAVLPLTTFATVLSVPLFAIAMTALRESARLRAEHDRQSDAAYDRQLRAFIRGVFAAVGIGTMLSLLGTAALLPRFLARFRVADSLSGSLAVAAAFLGCVSPVYLDQLQAAKRFGTVSLVEISAAALRLATMALLMPLRALAGYFAGGVVKTLVQICGPLLALRTDGMSARSEDRCPGYDFADSREREIASASYWTRDNILRLGKTFLLLLPYLALPMLVSFAENDLVRTLLPTADSAGYYLATRVSDLMNYVTYPILFVMFPYVTDKSSRGESYAKIVNRSLLVVFTVALIMSIMTSLFGPRILTLLPNGENYTAYADLLPMLIVFMAFGSAQTIITNAEVAAGRFTFLWWLVPLNLAYLELLPRLVKTPSLETLIAIFTAFAVLRFLAARSCETYCNTFHKADHPSGSM